MIMVGVNTSSQCMSFLGLWEGETVMEEFGSVF